MAGLALSDWDINIHFEYYFRNLDVDSKRRVINKFVESLTFPAQDLTPHLTLDELIEKHGPWDGPENLEEARVGYIRRSDEEK